MVYGRPLGRVSNASRMKLLVYSFVQVNQAQLFKWAN